MLLADPAFTVPPPGPSGPIGTMAWLRATVSRFASGETHARRRAIAETMLADLAPDELRAAAAAAAARELRHATAAPPAAAAPRAALATAITPDELRTAPPDAAAPPHATPRHATPPRHAAPPPHADLPYIPVAVLASALGVAPGDVTAAVAAVRVVAAAYHPGTEAPGADAALARLLSLLPPARPEVVAQRVALLVQACEATAALVRGALNRPLEAVLRDAPPVPATRRLGPDGQLVVVDLTGYPFGAGARACPGEAHARALAAGVVEGAR
jgi:hypothetical protein